MKMRYCFLLVFVLLFASNGTSREVTKMEGFRLSSHAFGENGHIPEKYTCDGNNISPPLLIENVPTNAKSLSLIVDDPDAPAGTWVHWVLWNVRSDAKDINENAVPVNTVQGLNDFGKHSYGGPCPPRGTHRYFFKLYALDTILSLGPDSRKSDLERAMKGHVIAHCQTIGLYQRR
jgi:Raf kinase inhibitor-like YbhB/YbcL family protein